MPLKPSANSDTRADCDKLERGEIPPPPPYPSILSYASDTLLYTLTHTTRLTRKVSKGQLKLSLEGLKKRGQSFAGLWARDHDIIIIMIFGIFSSLDTDFDTHDLWG